MERKGTLLSVRSDVRVLDATIRDGGLVNDFFFPDEFIRDLYQTNIKAGVDYMEFGYKADKSMFDPDAFGKWKFCDDEDIRAVVGENDTQLKVAVMADVGRCDYATYINTIPEALAMIEDAAKKGYETTCNIMAVSNCRESDIQFALAALTDSPVNAVYLVDSYGAMYPEEINRMAKRYLEVLEPAGKRLGIHAHNNQQCAFANTIEALSMGASYLDGTLSGMGRGAGNCALEALIGFLKNPRYQLDPLLRFIQKDILALKEAGCVWGYDIPYLLTGLLDQHPRTAIAATKAHDTNYSAFYQMLLDKD